MKRIAFLFTVAILVVILAAPFASARTWIVNGQISDTPPEAVISPESNPQADDTPVIDEEFINFDDLTPGGLFGSGVVLTNEYADLGIEFQGQGEVLNESGNFNVSGYSPPNFLAFNTGAGVPGPETMIFDPPVAYLTLWAGHASGGTITLEAFDENNNSLDLVSINSTVGVQEMTVEADAIYSAVISFTGTVLCIDDMSFEEGNPGPVTFHLYPTATTIPPEGGQVVYDAELISTLPNTVPGLFFRTYVELPNGQVFGPLTSLPFTLQPFMNIYQVGLTQNISSVAPAGEYIFTGWVGIPGGQFLEDTFTFTKTGASATGVDNWDATTPDFAGDAVTEVGLPSEFALEAAYPNPFNAATALTVTLPEAAELNVAVFNTLGQQVAQLADGHFQAGQHELTFDASNLTSGLYFVRATVPGQLNATQKVMLVR